MLQLELDLPSHHGWNDDRTLRWMDEFFPSNIHRVLIAANEEDDSDDEEDNEEIDDENDADIDLMIII